MADLILYNTDEVVNLFLRDVKLRLPSANTKRGSAPYVDAVTIAGVTPALFNNAIVSGNRALISKTFGSDLDELANDRKRPRLQGSGSFANVTVTTATTGGSITLGQTLKHKDTGESFQVTSSTGTYFTGNTIGVKSVGVGRQTNVSGKLIFDSPGAGTSPEVVIVGKATGGLDIESDADLQFRLQQLLATPPADGNIGTYLDLIYSQNHGVPVHQAFVYPSILNPGSIGIAFTVRGEGLARLPTAPQISAVETYVKANVPYDDCIFMLAVDTTVGVAATNPVIGIKFQPGETGFIDPDPFPKYNIPVGAVDWVVNTVPSPTATVFSVKNNLGVYTGSGIRAGQTIALWDSAHRKFVPKRILSFSGTGPYTITVDPLQSASDISYVPTASQRVSPWSTKLTELSVSIVNYYDNISPGENTSNIFDPGYRMKRFPYDSITYPYGVTSHVLDGISTRTDIQNVTLISGTNSAPPVGTPGVDVNMFILEDIGFYGI